jgi:hypothetical protein
VRVADTAVVRPDGEFEIAGRFIKHERHPDGHKTCRHPRIKVGLVGQRDVDESGVVELPQAVAREIRCAGQANIPRAVLVDEQPAVVEP